MVKAIILDAQSDDVYRGKLISISALAVDENGNVCDSFNESCVCKSNNDWIIDNVLPYTTIPKFQKPNELINEFLKWYIELGCVRAVFTHMGSPIEMNIFIKGERLGFIKSHDSVYSIFNIASMLLSKGESPTYLDDYVNKYNLKVMPDGDQRLMYNSLYDCYVQLEVLKHLRPDIFSVV